MGVDELALLDWIRAAIPFGITLAALLCAIALTWVLIRRLSDRWRHDAEALTGRLAASLSRYEQRQHALEREAHRYSPNLPPPYQDCAKSLHDLLHSTRQQLTATNNQLIEVPNPPLTAPISASARASNLLWFEPRAHHRRRARLRATQEELARLDEVYTTAEEHLRRLRRAPLDTADLARDLQTQLDAAFEVLDTLIAAELHGESLDRVAHNLTLDAQNLASLPTYLLDARESHILRRSQPDGISQIWQTLAKLKPNVYANLDTLLEWRGQLEALTQNLTAMRHALGNAKDRLMEADAQLDLTELHEAWQATQDIAEEAEQRFRQPTPEDLADSAQVSAITDQADSIVARLAVAEALRLSLDTRLDEVTHKLEEAERQLRQLAEAPRYPLDRVPFQAEMDRLHRRLTQVNDPRQPRSPKRLESDLATLHVLDQQAQGLVGKVTAAREDRRRLIALLDGESPAAATPDGAKQPDWLTWARDLQAQISVYAPDCWEGASDLRVATLLADAEALDTRRQRWIPARVDDLLAPNTLARQVKEVTAIQQDVETMQNRLDQATHWLQRLRQMEESARAKLQSVYAALDRLEIVAADLLPAELTEEENHWARVRDYLDTGYGLDLALQNSRTGSVRAKSEQVARWAEACATTLQDWQLALDAETRSALDTLDSELEALKGIARLDHEAVVTQAQNALASWESPPSKSALRRDPDVDPLVCKCTQLAAQVSERLRTLARLDSVTVKLKSEVSEPIAAPIDRWRRAYDAAEAAFGRLQRLEVQSGRSWPPVSCDTAVLRSEFELAERMQAQLYRDDTTVARVVATAEQLAEIYTRISTLAAERENAYQALRPKLDALLDRLDDWCNDLEAYGKQHSADPMVTSAIRARLDEIEAAMTQLHVEYDQAQDLVPGNEALRVLEALWRQATRDVPVGAGMNVIPVDWIARPH